MEWDDLRTFLAIARHGTLSAAARELGLTQPTIGRRLAAMEERTGARLLLRTPGGYVLTSLGESVLGHAERIEAEVLAADRAISGRDIALEGVVRITTVDIMASAIVTPALAALQEAHPGIIVELAPDTRSFSLSRREADIALRMTRFEGHEIFARRVGRLAISRYQARSRASDAPPPGLVTVLDDQAHLPEARWLRNLHPDAPITFRSNSREVQLMAARCGCGIAALPRFIADTETQLVRMETGEPDLVRDIWLGVHRDMRHMPRIRAAMDAVIAALAAHARNFHPDAARI